MQAFEPNTLLLDNALASMGAGLPSAMAVALLHPEKKVVAVCGDGGFMMNSQVNFGQFSTLSWFFVNPKKNCRGWLYRTLDDLYEFPRSTVILYHLVCDLESLFSTTHQKEEEERKSYVTMLIRIMQYVWVYVIYISSYVPTVYCTYIEVPIRIMH